MTVVESIESAIKEKGLTFKSLERECGLGNGTIRRWETQSPRLDGLLKVANYLHMSLDELVYGCSETETEADPAAHEVASSRFEVYCDGEPLTEAEADLVAMYRLLPEQHKEEIFELVHFKYKRIVEDKGGSIYSTYTEESKQQKSSPADGSNTDHETA